MTRQLLVDLNFNYYITNEFSGQDNPEFQQFLSLIRNTNQNFSYGKVQDVEGNIFDRFPEYSLVTCVSADFKMNDGMLKNFKEKFNNVERLRAEHVGTGGVAYLNYGGKFVYYLVIKAAHYWQPTYYSVWMTLQALKSHVIANNVRKLATTRIACAAQELGWSFVKAMFEFIFEDVDIEIQAFDITMPRMDNPNID